MKKTIVIAIVGLALCGVNAMADDAKAIFDKECAKCHGQDGKGDTKMGKKLGIKDLTDAKVQASFTDEKAFKAIKEGIKDGDKTLMKAAEGLTDDQIKALVAYVRKFKK
jgi:mono/diheme cytochrome c family protein